jgi:hypothetical protein
LFTKYRIKIAITIKTEIIKDSLPYVQIIYLKRHYFFNKVQRNNEESTFYIAQTTIVGCFMNITIAKKNKKR